MKSVTRKDIIGLSFVGLIFIAGLIIQITRRTHHLEYNYYISIAKVIDFKKNQRKGTTTSKHVLKFAYWDGEKMIQKFKNIEIGEYYTDSIEVGDLFIMKVSKTNSEFNEIFYNMKVDAKYGIKIP